MTDLHTALTKAAADLHRFAAAHGHAAYAAEFDAIAKADDVQTAMVVADSIPFGGMGTYGDVWLPALPGEQVDEVDVQFNTHLSAFITARNALRQNLGLPDPVRQLAPIKAQKSGFIHRFRQIASHRRAAGSDRVLATILAGIAGAANAGGFILLGSYTSHMTGYLSALADNIVLQNLDLVLQSLLAISLFVLGAASSAFTINWARAHDAKRQYSLPIGLQGLLLLVLAALGSVHLPGTIAHPLGLGLLSFIMGFQNATITKISYARIRTTHATGMITDVGIEVGRAIYGRAYPGNIHADRAKLLLLLQLLATFLVGGIVGALGYSLIGFVFSVPLALLLMALAWA